MIEELLSPSVPSDIEAAYLERHLAEQEIYRQALSEKEQSIQSLAQRIQVLEEMLERFSAVRPLAVPARPATRVTMGPPPRRWSARS